jgi:hypothetical protein
MEGNMALIGFAQLDTNNKYIIFLTQVHKETCVGLAVKLWVSISCAGAISSVKHTRVRKHQHKNEFVFFKILLANYKVVWRGSLFMGKTCNKFFFIG